MAEYDERPVALRCISSFQDVEGEAIGRAVNVVF